MLAGVPSALDLRALGAGEQLVPGREERALPVHPDRVARGPGEQLAHRVVGEQLAHLRGQRRADPVEQVALAVAQRLDRRGQQVTARVAGRDDPQRSGQQPGAVLEVVGQVLGALPGFDLDLDPVHARWRPGRPTPPPRRSRRPRRWAPRSRATGPGPAPRASSGRTARARRPARARPRWPRRRRVPRGRRSPRSARARRPRRARGSARRRRRARRPRLRGDRSQGNRTQRVRDGHKAVERRRRVVPPPPGAVSRIRRRTTRRRRGWPQPAARRTPADRPRAPVPDPGAVRAGEPISVAPAGAAGSLGLPVTSVEE